MTHRKERALRVVPPAFFVLCALLCLCLLIATTGQITDSDAASELMLGKLLADDGYLSPFSRDWYYSTELTVFNCHFMYGVLFHFIDSYFWVRLLGNIILCALLVLSYKALCWGAGLSSAAFWLGAGVLLLPVSVSYARIVLMHQFYTVHLMRAFVLAGLTLRLYREPESRRAWLVAALLLLESFFSGLAGPRQLAVTGIPLAMAAFCRFLLKDKPRRADAWLLLSLACMGVGYLVNSRVLSGMYRFSLYGETVLKPFNWRNLFDGFYYVIELCGYRPGVRAISLLGVTSVMGFFCAFILLWATYRACREKDLTNEPAKTILSRTFLFSLVGMQVTGHLMYGVAYSLYYIPAIIFALPSFFAYTERQKEPVFAHRLLLVFLMLSMLVNGALTTHWLGAKRDGSMTYGGLGFQNVNIVRDMQGVKDFLYENKALQGLSTFWNGNVLAEMSNGEIVPAGIHINSDRSISWVNWLTSPLYQQLKPGNAYLLLEKAEEEVLKPRLAALTPLAHYEDAMFSVYIYPAEVLVDWID